jgi:hypothetical protein
MKAIKQTLAWSLLILVVATGCKKYEEGPGFSLRSKTARVANDWKIVYANDYRDTLIVTESYIGETWEFAKDGNFIERDNGSVKNGKWSFISDKDSLQVTEGTNIDTYLILKLKENEMWLKDKDEELHLVPVK